MGREQGLVHSVTPVDFVWQTGRSNNTWLSAYVNVLAVSCKILDT